MCCGYVVCWTPNEISFFLNFVGYTVDFAGWFYHFIRFCSTNLVVPSSKRHKLTHYLGMTWCRLVLSLHSGTGVHQQLHQSAHLRCQVPRVPACRQTIKYDVIENCMAVPWQVVTLTAGVFLDGERRRRNAYDKTSQHYSEDNRTAFLHAVINL